MDLAQYERIKFELAAILRDAAILLREERPELHDPFRDLFARLAEDRFNLAVVGRFSRGKSSLMNAMLDTDRLPMGVIPLTSVITTVSYGSKERAFIEHEGWARSLAREIALDELPDYVTQKRNPGNEQRVAMARVELPAELLRRGFYFIDTPGLGSSIAENTKTTEGFLPEADAVMLVTSYDSPLSEEESQVIRGVASATGRIFLVINKHDLVSFEDRAQVLTHMREQAYRIFGDPLPRIFSLSARDAIEANKQHDHERYIASGLPALRDELTRFLLNEKQAEFLLRMCERVAAALEDVPNSEGERARLRLLHRDIAEYRSVPAPVIPTVETGTSDGMPRFSGCWICERIDRGMYDFLCGYQYDVGTRRDLQAEFVAHGGLCSFHTWQYEALASPRGTCLAFSTLLERLALALRRIATTTPPDAYPAELQKLRPTPETCDLCRTRVDIERSAVAKMAGALEAAASSVKDRFSGLCLDHLHLVLAAIGPSATTRKLIMREADAMERISEDMRRYLLKQDGVRRHLASAEELGADKRALMVLAGHRNVNALWKLQ